MISQEDQILELNKIKTIIGKPLALLSKKTIEDLNNLIVGYCQDVEGNIIGLNLRNCNLEKIHKEIGSLFYLEALWLDNNQIETIENIDTLTNLEYLGLSNNRITEMKNLGTLINLRKLVLNNNHIKKIENLDSLTGLQKLKLFNNHIKKIENLDTLTNLRLLGLYHNEIKKIENLEKLTMLESLGVGDNKIKKIENLDTLIRLKTLWLYKNKKIKKIENLDTLTDLQSLWLGNTSIKKIENLDTLVNLQYLGLDNNHIKKIEKLKKLESLRVLDLDNNKIEMIENFGTLNSLQEIRLHDNKIEKFKSLKKLKSLIVFGAKNNPLEKSKKEWKKYEKFQDSIKSKKLSKKILISGLGNIEVETTAPHGAYSYSIKSDLEQSDGFKGQSRGSIFITEEEAIKKSNELMYRNLRSKFEKSICAENLILLTGAGSSVECGGLSMAGLWDLVSSSKRVRRFWKSLLEQANYNIEIKGKNLEELLSTLIKIEEVNSELHKNNKTISNHIEDIKSEIFKSCQGIHICKESSHVRFLNRIFQVRSHLSSHLKVFTLNYDTVFEEAGEKVHSAVIDGFLFSGNKVFWSTEFDSHIFRAKTVPYSISDKENPYKEKFHYDNVFHLYKIHGSVNWEVSKKNEQGREEGSVLKNDKTSNPAIIYPNSSKFKKSFDMPFFEPTTRFQEVLRRNNTSLFIIGYGFGDAHINRMLLEAINNNKQNMEVFVIKPNLNDKNLKLYKDKIKEGFKNIHLINNTFKEFSTGFSNI